MQNTRYRHWRSRPYRRLLSNYRALKVSAEAAHAHLPPEAIISEADIAAIRASECQLLRSSAGDGIECVSIVVAGISAEERLASTLAEKEKQHKREMLALEASHSKETRRCSSIGKHFTSLLRQTISETDRDADRSGMMCGVESLHA